MILLIYLGAAIAQNGEDAALKRKPLLCGARCVDSVLQWYGCRDDFIKIVSEVNGNQFYEPAPMNAIANSLNSRGIHTIGIQVAPRDMIQWPNPIIVHSQIKGAHGHYWVWYPSNSVDMCNIWQDHSVGPEEQRLSPTGVLLLTSPRQIGLSQINVRSSYGTSGHLVLFFCVISFVVILYLTGRWSFFQIGVIVNRTRNKTR